MTKTGRIEDDTYRGTIFVLLPDGKVFEFNSGKYDIETFVGTVAQGNAFYDRESAELAARKRAAQVRWERLCEKHGIGWQDVPDEDEDKWEEITKQMQIDMELLK